LLNVLSFPDADGINHGKGPTQSMAFWGNERQENLLFSFFEDLKNSE
jgi:hypothetical protein